ncbi:MAG: bifunctional DNA-formamidopyrimidine glycosylase/DNA-(apurinic or apyrimidinic site) lyase [Deltaproteobacteria bacterium]
MPELPEVEVIRRGVAPHAVGRCVRAIAGSGRKMRLPLPRKGLQQLVKGHCFTGVERRAKYLLFFLDSGAVMVIHLGMTGRLGLFQKEAAPMSHDHLRLLLDNDMELRFNDPRRFGSVQLFAAGEALENFLKPLGPEPFSQEFSAAYLQHKAARKSRPVKNFLMDARVVVGIGNIYANEILFAAKTDPRTAVSRIKQGEWQKIVRETRRILNRAIEQGGTSIINFVQFSGTSGYFQNELLVYGREDQPCPRCRRPLQRSVMAGRATFYCKHCQR